MELPGHTNLQLKFLLNNEIAMIWWSYFKWWRWYGRSTGLFGGDPLDVSIIGIAGRVVGGKTRMEKIF